MASRTKQLGERFKKLKKPKIKSPSQAIRDGVASYKRRLQKEKGALAKEGRLKYVALFVSLASMMLALSFLPFFPQPLPLLVALLISFLVFLNPAIGMALGAIPVALGLLYHLSLADFIGMLGSTQTRVMFVCLVLFFFIALPIRFRRYEDSIGINLGIIAAMRLFFNQTFFIAIPLLITVGILFKKTQAGLALVYYALISVPLMVLQYFQHILTIPRVDFWNDPTAAPPIYTSLAPVFKGMTSAITQFRLFDVSISIGKIPWNIVETPPATIHTVGQAITQYMDSLPGMLLFITMVTALVWAISLILPSLARSNVRYGEKLFPPLTAAGATIIFYVLLGSLQKALAFSAKINNTQMMIGVLASLVIAFPVALLNFSPKKRAELEKNYDTILVKAGTLTTKIKAFETALAQVKQRLPIDTSRNEAKLKTVKDKLDDIVTRTTNRKLRLPESYDKIKELDTDLAAAVDNLMPELNTVLIQYQLNLNYAYTSWLKKLNEIGYQLKDPMKIEFQKEQPIEARMDYIAKLLEASKLSANEVCQFTENVYSIIRNMYDPTLPEQSNTVIYSKQKLTEKTPPWIACDALVIALKNWKKQYSPEISKSVIQLQESLTSIGSFTSQSATLQSVFGENYSNIMDEIKKAEQLNLSLKQTAISILNIQILRESLKLCLQIARDLLNALHDELKNKEKSIEELQPIDGNFWEKNVPLREQTAIEIDNISNSKKYLPRQMMENLPRALAIIEPCLWTISQYNVKNERLLNYPIAKAAIESLLKKKKSISTQDLPFEGTDAEEYMKLYSSEKALEVSFDQDNILLEKKA